MKMLLSKMFFCVFVICTFAAPRAQAQLQPTNLFQGIYGQNISCYGNIATDGGFVVTGGYRDFYTHGGYWSGSVNSDIFLIKLSHKGDVQWAKQYERGSSGEGATCVQPTSDGGFIISGKTDFSGLGALDLYLVKTDGMGDVLWANAFGTAENDVGDFVIEADDGGFVACGQSGYRPYLVKCDSYGILEWSYRYTIDQRGGYAMEVQQTSDGGFIVTGTWWRSGLREIFLMKLDKYGIPVWARTYGEGEGKSVKETAAVGRSQEISSGGYVVTGYRAEMNGPVPGESFLMRTNSIGQPLLFKTYGWPYTEEMGMSIVVTPRGDYVIGGLTETGPDDSGWLMKTDSSGVVKWSRLYGNTMGRRAWVRSLRRVADGGYFLAGYSQTNPGYVGGSFVVRTSPKGYTNNQDASCHIDMMPNVTQFFINEPYSQVSELPIGSYTPAPPIVTSVFPTEDVFCKGKYYGNFNPAPIPSVPPSSKRTPVPPPQRKTPIPW